MSKLYIKPKSLNLTNINSLKATQSLNTENCYTLKNSRSFKTSITEKDCVDLKNIVKKSVEDIKILFNLKELQENIKKNKISLDEDFIDKKNKTIEDTKGDTLNCNTHRFSKSLNYNKSENLLKVNYNKKDLNIKNNNNLIINKNIPNISNEILKNNSDNYNYKINSNQPINRLKNNLNINNNENNLMEGRDNMEKNKTNNPQINSITVNKRLFKIKTSTNNFITDRVKNNMIITIKNGNSERISKKLISNKSNYNSKILLNNISKETFKINNLKKYSINNTNSQNNTIKYPYIQKTFSNKKKYNSSLSSSKSLTSIKKNIYKKNSFVKERIKTIPFKLFENKNELRDNYKHFDNLYSTTFKYSKVIKTSINNKFVEKNETSFNLNDIFKLMLFLNEYIINNNIINNENIYNKNIIENYSKYLSNKIEYDYNENNKENLKDINNLKERKNFCAKLIQNFWRKNKIKKYCNTNNLEKNLEIKKFVCNLYNKNYKNNQIFFHSMNKIINEFYSLFNNCDKINEMLYLILKINYNSLNIDEENLLFKGFINTIIYGKIK